MSYAATISNTPLTEHLAKKTHPAALVLTAAFAGCLGAAVIEPHIHFAAAPPVVAMTPSPAVTPPSLPAEPTEAEIPTEPVATPVFQHVQKPVHVHAITPLKHHLTKPRHLRHRTPCVCARDFEADHMKRISEALAESVFVRPGRAPPLTVSHVFENLFRNLFSGNGG